MLFVIPFGLTLEFYSQTFVFYTTAESIRYKVFPRLRLGNPSSVEGVYTITKSITSFGVHKSLRNERERERRCRQNRRKPASAVAITTAVGVLVAALCGFVKIKYVPDQSIQRRKSRAAEKGGFELKQTLMYNTITLAHLPKRQRTDDGPTARQKKTPNLTGSNGPSCPYSNSLIRQKQPPNDGHFHRKNPGIIIENNHSC